MADMLKVTGLWTNTTKDGKKYLSGRLGDMRIMIFPNNFREADNHPTHIMYFTAIERQDTGLAAEADEFLSEDFLDESPVTAPAGRTPAPRPAAAAATPPARSSASAPRAAAPAGRAPARARQPEPTDDYGDNMEDPFAE